MQEFAVFVVPCDAAYDALIGARSLGVFTATDARRALALARAIHVNEIDPNYERLTVLPAYAAV